MKIDRRTSLKTAAAGTAGLAVAGLIEDSRDLYGGHRSAFRLEASNISRANIVTAEDGFNLWYEARGKGPAIIFDCRWPIEHLSYAEALADSYRVVQYALSNQFKIFFSTGFFIRISLGHNMKEEQ